MEPRGANAGEATRERPRLFVAAQLPETVRQQLGELQRRVVVPDDPFRWTRPEGVHVTLKFLGETPAAQIGAIERALARAVPGSAPFTLRLGRLGCFPSASRPRVLWIGLEGEVERLSRLQQRVDKRLGEAGFPRETRAFQPHVTLARARGPLTAEQVASLRELLQNDTGAYDPIAVSSIELMRSRIRPGGAVYEALSSLPLGGDGGGRWALGVGRWALGVRRWALGVGRWALGVGRWALEVWMPDAEDTADSDWAMRVRVFGAALPAVPRRAGPAQACEGVRATRE